MAALTFATPLGCQHFTIMNKILEKYLFHLTMEIFHDCQIVLKTCYKCHFLVGNFPTGFIM
jgi:hypothetical protein